MASAGAGFCFWRVRKLKNPGLAKNPSEMVALVGPGDRPDPAQQLEPPAGLAAAHLVDPGRGPEVASLDDLAPDQSTGVALLVWLTAFLDQDLGLGLHLAGGDVEELGAVADNAARHGRKDTGDYHAA